MSDEPDNKIIGIDLTAELARHLLKADDRSIAQRVKDGVPLTKGQRARLEEAANAEPPALPVPKVGRLKKKQWEDFAFYRANGLTQVAAYMKSGFNATERTAMKSAPILAARPEVAARIAELREVMYEQRKGEVMDLQEAMVELTKAARGMNGQIKPIDGFKMLAKLMGWEAPKKLVVTQGADLVIINPTDDLDEIPQDRIIEVEAEDE